VNAIGAPTQHAALTMANDMIVTCVLESTLKSG
jgi:hypothetical protein